MRVQKNGIMGIPEKNMHLIRPVFDRYLCYELRIEKKNDDIQYIERNIVHACYG